MTPTRPTPPTRLAGSALLRLSSVLATATAVSRVTGFIRSSVWAAALGLYTVGSAFTVANTIPTILYVLLAGGALNAVFVPQLVRAIADGEQAAAAYVDRLLTLTITVLGVLTALAVAAAPALAALYAGSGWSPADVALASAFAAWCLPQIFFFGLFAVLGQILHARGRPAPMMWAPVANNVIAIFVGVAFIGYATVDTGPGPNAFLSVSPTEIAFLGGGATLGIAVQALILVPTLRGAGFRYRPRWDLRGSGLGRSMRLAAWTLLFVAANQIAFSITAIVVNSAGKTAETTTGWAAGLPTYMNAYMIMLVPHAVVTVSIAAAMLPFMSQAAVDGRPEQVGAEVSRGLLLAGRVLVPVAAAMAATGPLITRLMFFGNPPEDTWFMGLVLVAFAPAIIFFSAQFLVVRGLHSLENTRIPALIQLVITSLQVATAVASYVLLPARWMLLGVAAGFSGAYAAGLFTSFAALRRATGGRQGARLAGPFLRWTAAAVPAAGAGALVSVQLSRWWGTGVASTATTLTIAALAFAAVYGATLRSIRPKC